MTHAFARALSPCHRARRRRARPMLLVAFAIVCWLFGLAMIALIALVRS